MKCPKCQIDLLMTDRQGIEIDFCSQCRGVWLDRGELDKIMERASRYSADDDDDRSRSSERRHEYDRGPDRPYDRDRGHYKRKSFWSELFD
jgi:Zn-finger nucleic acid-binding protein